MKLRKYFDQEIEITGKRLASVSNLIEANPTPTNPTPTNPTPTNPTPTNNPDPEEWKNIYWKQVKSELSRKWRNIQREQSSCFDIPYKID
jgi:hypothetical protein